MQEKINVRGVCFDNVTLDEALVKVVDFATEEGVSVMYTPNSEIVQNCIDNKALFEVINSADLVIPDGIGVVYASKILGTPLKAKVPGCEVAEKLLECIKDKDLSVFFFGGAKKTQDMDAVCDIAAQRMMAKYPGLKVAGTRDGYFTNQDEDDIIQQINESGADILFVCLGAPKQEKWIYDNKDKLKVKFVAGLGGTLDVFAGTAKRAPQVFLKTNLEWLYRLCCNPQRLGRMMNIPKFLLGTVIHKNKGCED